MRTLKTLFVAITFAAAVGCGDDGTFTVKGSQSDGAEVVPETTNNTSPNGDDSTTPDREDPIDDETPEPAEMDEMDEGCTSGLDMCGASCVDTAQSDEHCGTCGVMCPAGTECASSECACTDGGDLCGDSCVDTTSDAQHCGTCDNVCSGGTSCVEGGCVSLTEVAGVLSATNAARAAGQDCGQYGVYDPAPPLVADPDLAEAAQVHAVDMATNNFFSHTGSDGSSFTVRVGRTDYSGFAMGENIAGGGAEPAGVVQRWVDSDGHCRNLMNPQARQLGVGYTVGGQYGTMWVQVFGR